MTAKGGLPEAISRRMTRLEFVEGRDVWERQPGETKGRYYQFTIYRDLEPHERSYSKAAAILSRGVNTLTTIGGICRWAERIDAYDTFNERQRILEHRQRIRDQDLRVERILGVLTHKLSQRLVGDDVEEVQALDPNRITVADATKLAEVLFKINRLKDMDDRGVRDAEGIQIQVGFNFNPQYDSAPQKEDIELPPAGYRELADDVDGDRPEP